MADLVAMDLVPEPTILAAALRACRRVNDYSLTTRILEITKVKCADNEAEFWPYIMQVASYVSLDSEYAWLGLRLYQTRLRRLSNC